jgi:hypothetical protein
MCVLLWVPPVIAGGVPVFADGLEVARRGGQKIVQLCLRLYYFAPRRLTLVRIIRASASTVSLGDGPP